MRRKSLSESTPMRRRKWTADEIAVLVRNRLLDFFPAKHDALYSQLRRQVSGQSVYLDVLLKRGHWDHFRHWVAVTTPVWKGFDWKQDAQLEAMKARIAESQSQRFEGAGFTTGLEEPESVKNAFIPPDPEKSYEEIEIAMLRLGHCKFVCDDDDGQCQATDPEDESTERRSATTAHRLPHAFYLQLPTEERRQTFGRLYSYIYLMDQWTMGYQEGSVPEPLREHWPPVLRTGRAALSEDFKIIERTYTEKLKLSPQYFEQILNNYWTAQFYSTMRKRGDLDSPAFQLAKVLQILHHDIYDAYLEWIRFFRKEQLPRLRTIRKGGHWLDLIQATAGAFRAALEDDPLLNSVFHTEVFWRHQEVQQPTTRPGPESDTADRVANYAAVSGFRDTYPRGGPLRVVDSFSNVRGLSGGMQKLIGSIEGSSSYDFASPLLSALYGPGHFVSPDAVKAMFHRSTRRRNR